MPESVATEMQIANFNTGGASEPLANLAAVFAGIVFAAIVFTLDTTRTESQSDGDDLARKKKQKHRMQAALGLLLRVFVSGLFASVFFVVAGDEPDASRSVSVYIGGVVLLASGATAAVATLTWMFLFFDFQDFIVRASCRLSLLTASLAVFQVIFSVVEVHATYSGGSSAYRTYWPWMLVGAALSVLSPFLRPLLPVRVIDMLPRSASRAIMDIRDDRYTRGRLYISSFATSSVLVAVVIYVVFTQLFAFGDDVQIAWSGAVRQDDYFAAARYAAPGLLACAFSTYAFLMIASLPWRPRQREIDLRGDNAQGQSGDATRTDDTLTM